MEFFPNNKIYKKDFIIFIMKKLVGYIISLAGLIGLASTIEPVSKILPFEVPENIASLSIMPISIAAIIIGILIILISKRRKGGKGGKGGYEVPIYHGEKVVGYRRH
jgi:hypothetical protein